MSSTSSDDPARSDPPTWKLPRAERREQLLATATRTFAEAGYASTSLDDVATAAGVSRMILYRHFASKAELYQAVLERASDQLIEAAGQEPTESSIRGLMTWAADEPAVFRLIFHQAAREPDFRGELDQLRDRMTSALYEKLADGIPDERWARWAAQLSLTVTIEAILTWLDVGQPDEPHTAADHIDRAVEAIVGTVRQTK